MGVVRPERETHTHRERERERERLEGWKEGLRSKSYLGNLNKFKNLNFVQNEPSQA
jgi:hypothetical protein